MECGKVELGTVRLGKIYAFLTGCVGSQKKYGYGLVGICMFGLGGVVVRYGQIHKLLSWFMDSKTFYGLVLWLAVGYWSGKIWFGGQRFGKARQVLERYGKEGLNNPLFLINVSYLQR